MDFVLLRSNHSSSLINYLKFVFANVTEKRKEKKKYKIISYRRGNDTKHKILQIKYFSQCSFSSAWQQLVRQRLEFIFSKKQKAFSTSTTLRVWCMGSRVGYSTGWVGTGWLRGVRSTPRGFPREYYPTPCACASLISSLIPRQFSECRQRQRRATASPRGLPDVLRALPPIPTSKTPHQVPYSFILFATPSVPSRLVLVASHLFPVQLSLNRLIGTLL